MKIISVVIVNWNGKIDTIECLEALGKLRTHNWQLRTILVDNASSDGSIEEIRKKFPDICTIENDDNLGFTGGSNIGIKKSLNDGADYIWLLNNDTTVDKNSLVQLLMPFTDETVGITGSKIYFSAGFEYHKQRYARKDLGKVIWYAGGMIDWDNMYGSHRGVDEVDQGQFNKEGETPYITGCSMMVKGEVFNKIGLLDEKLFAYLEDLDFCLRAQRAGYKLIYSPASIVWHKNASSSGGVGSPLHEYYMTRNRLLIGMRYAPMRTKIALVREGVKICINGPYIRRRAIIDALTGRFGKRI